MKCPLIVVSLILPAVLLAACKPASMPPVMQGDIHAAADADLKRSRGFVSSSASSSISSVHDNEGSVNGISLESPDSLKIPGQELAQSPGPRVMENGFQSDESRKATADHSQQSKSQLTRKILVLQLLQTMSAARP